MSKELEKQLPINGILHGNAHCIRRLTGYSIRHLQESARPERFRGAVFLPSVKHGNQLMFPIASTCALLGKPQNTTGSQHVEPVHQPTCPIPGMAASRYNELLEGL